ncbi:hypothetical protein ATCC90586_005507 [Pythium insidiosum]|nr:hypothetical protein ATCC90586_005507 [Pythium insidiosum]
MMQREPSRRRANSNYFELEADRRRTKSGNTRSERLSSRLSFLEPASAPSSKYNSKASIPVMSAPLSGAPTSGGLADLDDDEISIDVCCERLKNKFGFQEGSVANQREHVLLLLANTKARCKPSDKPEHHIIELHKKLMSNYRDWCKFLGVPPQFFSGQATNNLRHPLHMDIMLYFLIWGEAANVRHMPECICYLFHQMMTMVNRDPLCEDGRPEGWYLTYVVRPIWQECSNMKRRNKLNKPLEHVQIRNYDDINEYFWKPHCLTVEVDHVGTALTNSHGKTFYEHRSIFTLVLNFYRIFQFNLMFLVLLIVLAFAATISPNGGQTGFSQFDKIGEVVFPYTKRDLKLAVVSIVLAQALLGFFKCVLEVAHGWHLLIAKEAKASSSRSFTYGSALVMRLFWNGGFAGLFAWMIYVPMNEKRDTELLGKFYPMAGAFLLPGLLVLLVQAFSPQLVAGTFAAKFVREGSSCYVGRHMTPPFSFQIRYVLFWLLLWGTKAIVSYFILVRPLMLPSLAIYDMDLRSRYHSSIISFNNMGVIFSLWLPVIFIFNYDTQIYFTIFQALLGAFMGMLMKTGEIRGVKEMTKAFRVAPQLFDQKIVTSLARASDAGNSSTDNSRASALAAAYESQMMLRFVVVWNEIVNWFRQCDLLDDKEAAILQYDIRSNGEVFEPVFLSAGKLAEALELALLQGMMMYEDAIKILHWLEIGSSPNRTAEQKQIQLQDMVRLKFSYICACQVYGKHRKENKPQADDIDYLLREHPNLRVAYVDAIPTQNGENMFDTVLIKSEEGEIVEVYRYQLPGDPILGEGKPENQNNALQFTRGEFIQTIDMNQEHYFEECLKMPQLLRTAEMHPSGKPVQIIGMREHIFTGNASSLAKFKTWQELVFVTLSQRVLANPLYCRMHYGHPDVFDKILSITRGGLSKARKLANGAGETSLSREAHRMGQFMDFFRLNSMYYSHTGFYFATWMTIVTTFVYMYSKVYIALAGVQRDVIINMDKVDVIKANTQYKFDKRVFNDADAVINTQFYIQAGLFLSLPLIAVYFGEMGLRRGFVRLVEMIVTLGPAFFIFQVGTTMHYFDNNLLHGEAQYKATGRGFKITRETFVLLYKAYASSHYRKAFELVGLCLVYLTFGEFNICDEDPTDNQSTYFLFCQTSQGFGVQTFAIWFIAVLWILSPFLFNTDGLDWEKTKADISAWTKWMYATADYEDQDTAMVGGWISWWKSELSLFHNSKPIARFTVILRESRHFLLTWYVVTLRWNTMTVGLVFGAAVVTVFILGAMGSFTVTGNMRPSFRAATYLFGLIVAIVTYFMLAHYAFGANSRSCFSIFFGYMGALYGINEMARMWSFQNSSVTNVAMFRELAFFFDFIFCTAMIVPLFIMSGIPFLNVIQTRMMYNKGFSEVVSASSQYAFSLAAFMGMLGGIGCGWIFYVFSTLETSPDFIGFVASYNLLKGKAGDGTVTAVQDMGEGFLFPGVGLLGCAVGILLPTIAMYIYEVSTTDMRGKALLLLGLGFTIGTLAAVYIFPESPYWVYTREGLESLERCLAVLRRKEGVQEEVKDVRAEEATEDDGPGTMLKFFVGLASMLLSAMVYGPLNMYMSMVFRNFTSGQYMFINCVALQFLGALFSFFFIDRVDHRRILMATLLPTLVLVAIMAMNVQTRTWTDDAEYLMLQIVGLLTYFFIGLGTSSVLWLTCVGLFTTKPRMVYTTGYFVVFFLLPLWSLYLRVHSAERANREYVYLYALCGCIVLLFLLLIGVDSRKNGMICTKKEAEEERARVRRERQSRRSARTPGSARARNLSRTRGRSHSNYQMYESPAGGAP